MKIRDFIIEQLINKEAEIVADTIIVEIDKKLERLKEEIFATNDMEEVKKIKAKNDELQKLLTAVLAKPLEVDLDEVEQKLNSQIIVHKVKSALNERNQSNIQTIIDQIKAKGLIAKEHLEKVFDKEKE
jgi:hypothetical protein